MKLGVGKKRSKFLDSLWKGGRAFISLYIPYEWWQTNWPCTWLHVTTFQYGSSKLGAKKKATAYLGTASYKQSNELFSSVSTDDRFQYQKVPGTLPCIPGPEFPCLIVFSSRPDSILTTWDDRFDPTIVTSG